MSEYSDIWKAAPEPARATVEDIVGDYKARWHAAHPPEAWEEPERVSREQNRRDADPFIQQQITLSALREWAAAGGQDAGVHFNSLKDRSFDAIEQQRHRPQPREASFNPDPLTDYHNARMGRSGDNAAVNLRAFWNEVGVTSDRDAQTPVPLPAGVTAGRQIELWEHGMKDVEAEKAALRQEAKVQIIDQSSEQARLWQGETEKDKPAAEAVPKSQSRDSEVER